MCVKQRSSKIEEIPKWVLLGYFFIMLGFFPLSYRLQYRNMGDLKYQIFTVTTLLYLICSFSIGIFMEPSIKKKGKMKNKPLDGIVFLFLMVNGVSYLFASDKQMGFWGSGGWFMGLFTVLLLLGSYFAIEKNLEYLKEDAESIRKWGIKILLISSFFVYLVAVLHRFGVDPLGIYGNLPERYRVEFLSTIGQSSWYSSFLCTVWPVGLYLFYQEENSLKRVGYGLYVVVGAMSLVSQNTDTAFLSLAAIFMVLFYLCQEEQRGRKRWLQCVLLVLASFRFMGVLQLIFSKHMVPLEQLSICMSQGRLVTVLLILTILLYGTGQLLERSSHEKFHIILKKGDTFLTKRKLFYTLCILAGLFLIGTILFIVLNTTGVLQKSFGMEIQNPFLYFNEMWGNLRGFIWRISVDYYRELSPMRKFIGVGPDCYSAYTIVAPQIGEQIEAFFTDLRLTNAHNEYLTKLIDLGMVGLFSYGSIFIVAMRSFYKERRQTPFMGCMMLVIVSYCVHNIFCYEQVCSTAIFYIILAIGNSYVHNREENCGSVWKNREQS